jgi:hypothetical protein
MEYFIWRIVRTGLSPQTETRANKEGGTDRIFIDEEIEDPKSELLLWEENFHPHPNGVVYWHDQLWVSTEWGSVMPGDYETGFGYDDYIGTWDVTLRPITNWEKFLLAESQLSTDKLAAETMY